MLTTADRNSTVLYFYVNLTLLKKSVKNSNPAVLSVDGLWLSVYTIMPTINNSNFISSRIIFILFLCLLSRTSRTILNEAGLSNPIGNVFNISPLNISVFKVHCDLFKFSVSES